MPKVTELAPAFEEQYARFCATGEKADRLVLQGKYDWARRLYVQLLRLCRFKFNVVDEFLATRATLGLLVCEALSGNATSVQRLLAGKTLDVPVREAGLRQGLLALEQGLLGHGDMAVFHAVRRGQSLASRLPLTPWSLATTAGRPFTVQRLQSGQPDGVAERARGWRRIFRRPRLSTAPPFEDADLPPLQTWRCGRMVRELQHGGLVERIVVSPSGHYLATWNPMRMRLWDARNGELLGTVDHDHFPLTFSPDESELVTSGDGRVERWSVDRLRSVRTHPALTGRAVSEGFESIAGFTPDNAVALFNTRTLKVTRLGQPEPGLYRNPYCLAFSPDRTCLAEAHRDRVVVWDTALRMMQGQTHGTGSDITAVRYTPDGRWLLCGNLSGSLFVFDARDLRTVGRMTVDGEIRGLDANDDLQAGVASDKTSEVWLFDLEKGSLWGMIDAGENRHCWSIAFMPADLVAIGHDDGFARLWSLDGEAFY